MRITRWMDPSCPSGDVNVIEGIVTRVRQGLTCTAACVRVGQRTDLTARWTGSNEAFGDLRIGQRVKAVIPAESVRLEAGWVRRSMRRWNRWIGRIVMVQGERPDLLVSVKVHGESWTLRGRGPVVGAAALPQTWDTVNIVVDPQAVRLLSPIQRAGAPTFKGLDVPSEQDAEARVQLSGRIECVRSYGESVLLLLVIGQVHISALVSDTESAAAWWRPGMPVEIHMGRFEVRVNPKGSPDRAAECRLAYHQ